MHARLPLAVPFILGLTLAALPCQAQNNTINMCIGSTSTNLLTNTSSDCAFVNVSTVYSINFGASLPTGPTGLPNGKPAVSQIYLQKALSPSSALLFKDLLSGATIDSVAIGINTPGPNNTTVNTTLRLTGVQVSYLTTYAYPGNNIPSEAVSLVYQKMEIIDNSTIPATTVTWLSN